MFKSLELFQAASAVSRHAANRQSVVAQNIANANTPDYRAKDLTPFKQLFDASSDAAITRTRPGHAAFAQAPASTKPIVDASAEISPNGNSVSLETEMLKSIEAERQHSRALSIYQHSMSILKTSIGRGR